jgi:hypothetical protein
MCENNYLKGLFLAGLLLLPVTVSAVPGTAQEAHRLPGNDEFQSTIENRCTICHTRGRVDKALGQEQNLDDLLQRMIERGAIISERDRNVLGTFWGSPLKDGEPSEPTTE